MPQVPLATNVASSQQKYNVDSATGQQQASNYGQNNIYGNVSYQQTGINPQTGMPIYSANQNLSPTQQAIASGIGSGQVGAAGGIGGLIASGNYGGAPNIVGTSNSLTNQMMGNYLGSVTPWLNASRNQLDNQLRNQGILPAASGGPQSDTAYGQQMGQLEQSQLQGIEGAAAQFQPAAFSEAMQNYQLPLQTAGALQQFATSPEAINPNQAAVSGAANQLQPANLIGATTSQEQAQMAAYQAQMAQQSSMMGGLFGAAGTIGAAALGIPKLK